MRFSLLSLFGLLAFCALCLGALANASYLLASAFFSATLVVLSAAVIAAMVGSGQARTFWLAFAVFGWGHFILALGPWFDDHTGEFMLTRHLVDSLGTAMGHEVANHQEMPGMWLNLPYAAGHLSAYRYLAFVVIGQCSFSIGLGWLGAFIASRLHGRLRSPE